MKSSAKLAFVALAVLVASEARAVTITVNTTAQKAASNTDCTLGDAITAANTDLKVNGCSAGVGADTIVVAAGTYTLSTIAETMQYDGTVGLPRITGALTIQGADAATTILERSANAPDFRILMVDGVTLTLSKVTIRGGKNQTGGGIRLKGGKLSVSDSIFTGNDGRGTSGGSGGGIGNGNFLATVTITNCTFSGNYAGDGGGVSILGTLTVTGSTFTSNVATSGGGGGLQFNGYGGAPLLLKDSTFTDNASNNNSGGGLYLSAGSLALTNVVVKNNHATGANADAGGIYARAPMTLTTSTIAGNDTDGHAGGLRADYTVTIVGSTISGNKSTKNGGGIWGPLVATSSTISDNEAGKEGGGIYVDNSDVTLNNVTIAGNIAHAGAGGGLFVHYSAGNIQLANTILAGNLNTTSAASDCSRDGNSVKSLGYNFIGADACTMTGVTGDQIGTSQKPLDAQLGPLADNGGTTLTQMPNPGSPVLDAANPVTPGSAAGACAASDQRGIARPIDGNYDGSQLCDIGAVEAPAQRATDLSIDVVAPATAQTGAQILYAITVKNNGPAPAPAVTLSTAIGAANFISAIPTQGTCTQAFPIQCALGFLDNGASATINILSSSDQLGPLAFSATVAGTATDPVSANDSKTVNTTIQGLANLSIAIPAVDGAIRGLALTQSVAIFNSGPTVAASVVLTASTAGVSWTAVQPSLGTCSGTTNVTCHLGSIASGGSATVQFKTTAGASDIVLNAAVTSAVPDPDSSDNTAATTISVTAIADLSVAMTLSDTTGDSGRQLVYAATVGNAGPSEALSVDLAASLPAGATFVSATSSTGTCAAPGTTSDGKLHCALGAMPKGDSRLVTFTMGAGAGGPFAATVQVSAAEVDPNPSDNAASARTSGPGGADGGTFVDSADVAVDLTATPTFVKAGQPVSFAVRAGNGGSLDASDVQVTVDTNGALTVKSATIGDQACTVGTAIVCAVGTLRAGENVFVNLVVVPASAGVIRATARATASTLDLDPANDAATLALSAGSAGADLSVTLSVSSAVVSVGEPFLAVATVTNAGPDEASGVAVSDALPDGLTLLSAMASVGSCAGSTTVSCALGDLKPGGIATVSLLVKATAAGEIKNSVSVDSKTTELDAADNQTSMMAVATPRTTDTVETPVLSAAKSGGLSCSAVTGGSATAEFLVLALLAVLIKKPTRRARQ